MATPVILPKQGNSVESVILQSWHKQPGDSVSTGDVLCEVETDKAVMEVEAPADGTLIDIFFAADDEIPVLTTIAAIGEAGEDVSARCVAVMRQEMKQLRPLMHPPQKLPAPPQPQARHRHCCRTILHQPRARAAAHAPARAADHAIDLSTVGGTGPEGRVIERDVQAAAANAPRLSAAAKAALAGGTLQAPARGSGPNGLVLVEDLLPIGAEKPAAAPAAVAAPAPGTTTEIPVRGIRKIIAERMMHSLQSTAQLTMSASVKATALQAYRAKCKAQAETLGLPNITVGDMIVFAVSRVLPRFPELNAHFLGDKVVQFSDINIGVAVDTERGLLVPVIKQAQAMTLSQLSAHFKPIAKDCQQGSVNPELLSGGTFTVTNLGALGVDTFTPVLNAPEVAILGVGGLRLLPYAGKDGGVDHIPSITLSLTIDHQGLDGAPAARFLQALTHALENFDLLLAQ